MAPLSLSSGRARLLIAAVVRDALPVVATTAIVID